MNSPLRIHLRRSPTGLHLCLTGCFTPEDAPRLHACLLEKHVEGERLFVDVRNLEEVPPAERLLFWQCLAPLALAPSQIYFKGAQGFTLGREGCRVLIKKAKSCSCSGACPTCACRERARERQGERLKSKRL